MCVSQPYRKYTFVYSYKRWNNGGLQQQRQQQNDIFKT